MKRNRVLMYVVCLLGAGNLALVAIPYEVVRPSRVLSRSGLLFGLAIWRSASVLAPLFALAAALCLVALWNRAGIGGRAVATVAACVAVAAAALAGKNLAQRDFDPLFSPRYLPPAQAKVDPDDLVLAVGRGSQARAYPIRMMVIHHIVNDVIAGVPVAVTY